MRTLYKHYCGAIIAAFGTSTDSLISLLRLSERNALLLIIWNDFACSYQIYFWS